MNRRIPDGYEVVQNNLPLMLRHRDSGVVITVIELVPAEKEKFDHKYTHRVAASNEHRPIYGGVFKSGSRAKDKAFELAEERP